MKNLIGISILTILFGCQSSSTGIEQVWSPEESGVVLKQTFPQENSESSALEEYLDQDLRSLSEQQHKELIDLLKSILSLSDRKIKILANRAGDWRCCGPWYLWKRDGSSGFLLFWGHRIMSVPGESSASIYLLDEKCRVVSTNRFRTAYRGDIRAASYKETPCCSGKVVRIETAPVIGGAPSATLFIGIEDQRPALIRFENKNGTVGQNKYYAPNWTVGPPVPTRSPDKWAAVLKHGSAIEILEALVWLGGDHLDPSERRKNSIEESPEDLSRYLQTIQSESVVKKLQSLANSTNSWISQAATQVLEKKSME